MVLLRRGFTKQSLLAGTEVFVEGFQAKDGSNKANGRDVTFVDGRKLFLGSSGTGVQSVCFMESCPGFASIPRADAWFGVYRTHNAADRCRRVFPVSPRRARGSIHPGRLRNVLEE